MHGPRVDEQTGYVVQLITPPSIQSLSPLHEPFQPRTLRTRGRKQRDLLSESRQRPSYTVLVIRAKPKAGLRRHRPPGEEISESSPTTSPDALSPRISAQTEAQAAEHIIRTSLIVAHPSTLIYRELRVFEASPQLFSPRRPPQSHHGFNRDTPQSSTLIRPSPLSFYRPYIGDHPRARRLAVG